MDLIPRVFLLTSVIMVSIWGIFLFNLDDSVFGLIKSKDNIELESSKIINDFENNKKLQEIGIAGIIDRQDEPENEVPKLTEINFQDYKEDEIIDEQNDQLKILEKEKFYLKSSGKKIQLKDFTNVELNAVLLPIKGTKLTNFDLIEAELIVGKNTYNFNKGSATIQKDEFELNIISDIENEIFFSITGKINFKITENVYSGKVVFKDEQFYIYKPENKQFTLPDHTMTISSIP